MKEQCSYAIERWGAGYFAINSKGQLTVHPDPEGPTSIDLISLVQQIEAIGLSLPVLVRFTDILRHRVGALNQAFRTASKTCNYHGSYRPLYPIKVNQQAGVIREILATGQAGLEAGSKPELLAVLALAPPGEVIVCNGYKDREYLRLALIGTQLGLKIYLVIEKISELYLLIEVATQLKIEPLLGVRVRLAAAAAGKWQNSGGEQAKFGLTPQQVLNLIQDLKSAGYLKWLKLLHAHLGSQIPNLQDIRAGIAELARFYTEIFKHGAPLDVIDIGGGLGVDYEGTRTRRDCSVNYTLEQYAHAVITGIASECYKNGLPEPTIFSESGRALTAHHAVLLTNIIEREQIGRETISSLNQTGETTLDALLQCLNNIELAAPQEIYAEAREKLTIARERFVQGQLDLSQRAQADEIFLTICRKLATRLNPSIRGQRELSDVLHARLADRLFCNFSLFQSLPDSWALDQIFPIMPIQRLTELPTTRAVIHDLTCDSDGQINHYVDTDGIEASLRIHNDAGQTEPYLLGFFMIGAYQEILGDIHNLFGDPDAINVILDPAAVNGYRLIEPESGDATDELLNYVHFEPRHLLSQYRQKLNATSLDRATREQFFSELKAGLYGYTYLN